jgi:hypothetical protein
MVGMRKNNWQDVIMLIKRALPGGMSAFVGRAELQE